MKVDVQVATNVEKYLNIRDPKTVTMFSHIYVVMIRTRATFRASRKQGHVSCSFDTVHGCDTVVHRFPEEVTLRQRYSLLGNSLSVDVVSALLQHLLLI